MADKYDHIQDEKERIALIRQQQRNSFIKFFLGTFVLGILTAGINFTLHSREIKMQKMQHQNDQVADYLGQFMHGGTKEQLAFANFMRFSAVEEDERTRYKDLFFYLKNRSDSLDAEAEKNQKEALLAEASLEKAMYERERLQNEYKSANRENQKDLRMKLDLARMQETTTELQLKKLNQNEEAIAIKLSNPVESLEIEPKIVEDVIIPMESANFTEQGWSIDGRFMQYDQIRVMVYDPLIKKQKATLKVYFIGADNSQTLIGTEQLKAGEVMELQHDTPVHKYDITLTLDKVSKFYKVRNKAEWTLTQKKTAK